MLTLFAFFRADFRFAITTSTARSLIPFPIGKTLNRLNSKATILKEKFRVISVTSLAWNIYGLTVVGR